MDSSAGERGVIGSRFLEMRMRWMISEQIGRMCQLSRAVPVRLPSTSRPC